MSAGTLPLAPLLHALGTQNRSKAAGTLGVTPANVNRWSLHGLTPREARSACKSGDLDLEEVWGLTDAEVDQADTAPAPAAKRGFNPPSISLVWEEPPPPVASQQVGRRSELTAVFDGLRAKTGEWARVRTWADGTDSSQKKAVGTASHIRKSYGAKYLEGHQWEARHGVTADGCWAVWARHIAPLDDEAS